MTDLIGSNNFMEIVEAYRSGKLNETSSMIVEALNYIANEKYNEGWVDSKEAHVERYGTDFSRGD